jgi:hypothetical protein
MNRIWETIFYCDACKSQIIRAVYGDNIRELSDKQKEQFLKYSRQLHHYEKHLSCWRCRKNIKVEQIESIIPLPNGQAGDLCKDCAEKYHKTK